MYLVHLLRLKVVKGQRCKLVLLKNVSVRMATDISPGICADAPAMKSVKVDLLHTSAACDAACDLVAPISTFLHGCLHGLLNELLRGVCTLANHLIQRSSADCIASATAESTFPILAVLSSTTSPDGKDLWGSSITPLQLSLKIARQGVVVRSKYDDPARTCLVTLGEQGCLLAGDAFVAHMPILAERCWIVGNIGIRTLHTHNDELLWGHVTAPGVENCFQLGSILGLWRCEDTIHHRRQAKLPMQLLRFLAATVADLQAASLQTLRQGCAIHDPRLAEQAAANQLRMRRVSAASFYVSFAGGLTTCPAGDC
mmetsp:Transcript_46070/g.81059  ORF Transcript_46070/g.81059 Transcript_46070/m.81059 type:complete len:313 (+) Transcript_46070:252-1190(+)